jgi:hypothetical protein
MAIELILMARAAAQPTPVVADACATMVPPSLGARIATELPGYTLPRASEVGEVRARDISNKGDWPCPFVVAGDFDGNGSLDRALLVKSPQGAFKLVAALNNNGQWQLSLSEDWPLPLAESEVRPAEPGLYQRSDAIDHPAAMLDQLPSIQAENSGFSASKVNGRRAVYFLVGEQWQKLTVKDY